MKQYLVQVPMHADLTIEAKDEESAREKADKWAQRLAYRLEGTHGSGLVCDGVFPEDVEVQEST